MTTVRPAIASCATEWGYASGKQYADPFREVTLDVVVTGPDGAERTVPTFWSGEHNWRVRYAAPGPGRYRYRTVCSDAANGDLHDQRGEIEVAPYAGRNPLLRHGPLRVSASRRHLEHGDGTPFFWLGDTWWMGLCRRLHWPEDFRLLLADRGAKGFTVVQIVAGLYPDMPWRDERGANEAGFPWTEDFSRIEPAYFDQADLRIQALVQAGIVPCIVGCWGYFVRWMGRERLCQHWRNLIARYGAYPVVWCLAGEGAMPYYLSTDRDGDRVTQMREWTAIGRYVRETDPYGHPLTIHPTSPASSRDQLEDPSILDLDMLQTGHSDRDSITATIETMTRAYDQTPPLPVLNSEVCYEGILEASRQEIQRFMFWSCLLSGACGHTYGANGVWQVNGREVPYGPSPHGFSWGDVPWEDAYRLPGAAHVALGKRLLERFEWWRFEPRPEWVTPRWSPENYQRPYAAGIPGQVRVIFFPTGSSVLWRREPVRLIYLEPGVSYRAYYVNPSDGGEHPRGTVQADAGGTAGVDTPPVMRDWVLVLDAR